MKNIFKIEDITLTDADFIGGITYNSLVNSSEDLTLGSACSAEIEFTCNNDLDLINKITNKTGLYKSADLKSITNNNIAKIIRQKLIVKNGDYYYSAKRNEINVWNSSGIKINSSHIQPTLPILSLFIVDNILYTGHSQSPYLSIYIIENDNLIKQPDSMFTKYELWKIQYLNSNGNCFNMNANIFEEYITDLYNLKPINLRQFNYEYKDIGYFIVEKPIKSNNTIKVKAFDKMILFDKVVDNYVANIIYPITVKNILIGLCKYIGIEYKYTNFINEDYLITNKFKVEGITGRILLQWIAEMTGSYAYIDGFGKLNLDFYKHNQINITNNDFITLEQADYKVTKIDKMQAKVEDNDIGVIVGTGENNYVIQNNPLLYSNKDTELRPIVEAIFNKIKDFEYTPFTIKMITDFGLKAGDIFTVNNEFQAVIMSKKADSSGVEFSATGNYIRDTQTSMQNQQLQRLNGKSIELRTEIDGFGIKLTENIKDVTTIKENVTEIVANVDGITAKVSSHTTEIGNIQKDAGDFKTLVNSNLEELQKQIDGQITTFFYGYEPTLNNLPASEWITDKLKENHAGDLFYNSISGLGYRFSKDKDVWQWVVLKDTEVVKALANAQKAQDTADGKRRIFIITPTPPYDVGDTWANATYAGEYSNDLLVCIKSKANNATFDISDWRTATKYTDNSVVDDFINNRYKNEIVGLRTQIDEKADIWYQEEDPSEKWGELDKTEHVGDMWCNSSTKETFIYSYYSDSGTFAWESQGIPQEVFDKIDGKSSLYVTRPTSYNKNDMWIVENDNVIPPYKTGDWLTAIRSNTVYNPNDWDDKVRYGKDIDNLKTTTETKFSEIKQTTDDITLTVSSNKTSTDKAINAKSSTYTKRPSIYSIGDTWIVENDTIAPPYKTGDMLTAIKSNTAYDLNDWSDKVRYGKDITITTDKISAIEVTVDNITSKVSETNKVVGEIGERVEKAETTITQNTTDITLRVTKEDLEGKTGTELTIKPEFVQIAWNNITQYIHFGYSDLGLGYVGIEIRDIFDNTLMLLSWDGMNLYNENLLVGQFTTNYLDNKIRGTAQTCNSECYISWELVRPNGNELIMGYFDKDVYVYRKNMRAGLNIGRTVYFHQNPLILDESEEVIISAKDGNMSIRHSVSGSHSITFGGNAGAVFTNDGLNMMGGSITDVNILSYNYIQTKGRSVSKKGFIVSYSSEKLHTHVDEVEVIAGDNIIELPEFFKEQGVNYHVFLSKQGKGDVWYNNKTSENFVIHSDNPMTVSYEIKFIIVEQPRKQVA